MWGFIVLAGVLLFIWLAVRGDYPPAQFDDNDEDDDDMAREDHWGV